MTVSPARASGFLTWPRVLAGACALVFIALLLTGKLPIKIPGVPSVTAPASQTSSAPSQVEAAPAEGTTNAAAPPDANNVQAGATETAAAAAPGTSDISIFFEVDSDTIPTRYQDDLAKVAETLHENPGSNAIIEGHTDDQGAAAYNLDLSSRRALAVRDALVFNHGVPATRLSIIGAGSATPLQPNETPTGRAYNRRVEVKIVKVG